MNLSHKELLQSHLDSRSLDLSSLDVAQPAEPKAQNETHKEAQNTLKRLLQSLFREKLLPIKTSYGEFKLCLQAQNSSILVTAAHFGTLDRLLSIGEVWHLSEEESEQITEPKQLLDLLEPELKQDSRSPLIAEKWEQFKHEIENHLENSILLSEVQTRKVSRLQNSPEPTHWIEFLQKTQPWIDFSLYFEQAITRGHPIHPCSKTKLGLDREEVVQFSPEFHPVVQLKLGAIHRDRLHVESMGRSRLPYLDASLASYRDFFAETFPKEYSSWADELHRLGKKVDQFLPLPIHPWQEKNQLPIYFSELLKTGDLLILNSLPIRTAPSLSFRTMIPLDYPFAPTLKLPVTVQATSLRRTLPIASADATPKISAILKEVFSKESNFGNRLEILCEPFGLYLKDVTYEQGKHLSMIIRESPKLKLQSGEIAVVVAALFEPSPVSGLPLVLELFSNRGKTDLSQAKRCFEDLCDLVVGSYLKLYLVYGITLYGHQQNTLAVIRDGRIVRLIARDLEDVYIHEPTFNRQGYSLQLHPKSAVLWKDRTPGRNTLLHSVFQLHLGEVVLALSEHFHCNAGIFWKLLAIRIEREFNHLLEHDSLSTAVPDLLEEREAILESPWPCKTLLKMRLQRHATDDSYVPISNPLALKN